jgi:hypothetical protein
MDANTISSVKSENTPALRTPGGSSGGAPTTIPPKRNTLSKILHHWRIIVPTFVGLLALVFFSYWYGAWYFVQPLDLSKSTPPAYEFTDDYAMLNLGEWIPWFESSANFSESTPANTIGQIAPWVDARSLLVANSPLDGHRNWFTYYNEESASYVGAKKLMWSTTKWRRACEKAGGSIIRNETVYLCVLEKYSDAGKTCDSSSQCISGKCLRDVELDCITGRCYQCAYYKNWDGPLWSDMRKP